MASARPRVKVAFGSGSEDLIPTLVERMQALEPELPLYVVSEFPAPGGRWIPYHVKRGVWENLARIRAALKGGRVRFSAVILQPRMPYWRMRLAGFLLSPVGFIAFNENLDHYMLRPRSAGTMLRHALWRAKNFARWHTRPGGALYTLAWRLIHPRAFLRPLANLAAVALGWGITLAKALLPARAEADRAAPLEPGISVVVPSRGGRDLLESMLPGLVREMAGIEGEILVVDNGSQDGTAGFLADHYPQVRVLHSPEPLSFARAVNRGIGQARFSHVCLLNNDMALEPGFFAPLRQAFSRVPDLFCATAQILFPEGRRRQETGKAVMPEGLRATDFPVSCEVPVEGEDLSYVLYGSGGCSLYDTAKLRRLGGFGECYQPAYVEDLDAGYRAWLRGWPTVFVAGARVLHQHRATTSRYYPEAELERVLEVNYLRFLARAVASPRLFRRMWKHAVRRLNHLAARLENPPPSALPALARAFQAAAQVEPPPRGHAPEERFLALASGAVAVFPCRAPRGKPVVLIASPYPPFPLSHGGAVRMYNLMRRAGGEFDQVLVAFVDRQAPPPPELAALCVEIVQVTRVGTHLRRAGRRPDIVEEFDSLAFRAALGEMMRKWRPQIAQLEFTQMAQYARECAPARTLLVEHDVTFDLYQQLLGLGEDWELQRQLGRWREFETAAWREVDCVVTMSRKDQAMVTGARAEVLANGVDLERFQPSGEEPEPRRLLFIGSFAHLPNLMAVDFFLREVFPRLASLSPVLHIIAGARHRYFLEHYRERLEVNLELPGLELEDFVSDVRPAYRRAAVVVAPLVASAGTNIKIMEAMAMGKAIVSTPAGINGLDLAAGVDLLVTPTARGMAEAIAELLAHPQRRRSIERQARATVESRYDWDHIAQRQARLYRELAGL